MENIINSGMASFLTMTHLLNVNVSKEQLNHILSLNGGDMTEIEMMTAARLLKIKGKIKELKYEQLEELNVPVICKAKDDTYFIVGKTDNDKVMILKANKPPKLISVEEFRDIFSGTVILLSNKSIIDKEAVFGFKWSIPTILKYKKEFIEVLVAVFVIQILGILTPLVTQVIVDKVLVHRTLSTLYVLVIGLFLGYVFEMIIGLAKSYVFTHTTNRIDVMLSDKLFKHLFALPLRYFESRRTGETVARVRELDSIRSFLTGTPLSSLIDLFFIIIYIIILFFYSVPLTFVVIASMPVFAILSIIVTPLFKQRLDEKFNAGAETQSYLVECITGVQTIKSFALEPKVEKKWGSLQADYVKAGYKTSIVAGTANTLGQFIQKTFDLLILFMGAKYVMAGRFTVGELVAFRMLSGRVSGPVLRFVQLWQEYQQASMSVKRIGDIFNTSTEPRVDINKLSLPPIKGRITFEKVKFRYRIDAPEVIKNISFDIEPGQIIGVVGRSGSGKSTISKLIQRLYIPESGKIMVDGVDISLVDPAWLRGQIGVVLQENFMFNGSIAENISIHCPGVSMEKIIAAAKIAGANDFIMHMQNGYDTMIGEKGVGLSGGQKQRIAIARAIISNPRILIFDEATSALDYESESIIQNNLQEICKGRTVLIIAHRLSTLKDANKIMVIDNGELVEFDTKEKLMSNQGLYYYLYNMQKEGRV